MTAPESEVRDVSDPFPLKSEERAGTRFKSA